MIKTEEMNVAQQNDAELVAKSLERDQNAFRQIVERYQTLICSLAYCATGSVSQSEDLAQETFVIAWNDLAELREPSKLRSWLCAIVRFRISKQFRQRGREPVHAAEPLEAANQSTAPEPLPSHQAISNEEKAILWRSLERIPETYREPLVLFYREHQSIERVAEALDLSEDAVKQRLSRGRKLLQEEFIAFVEGALARTNPGQAFTLGVLATLPITLASSAKAATIAAAAAKGGAVAKGAMLGSVLAVLFGPVLGLIGGFFGLKMTLDSTRTPRERTFIKQYIITVCVAVAVFCASLLLFMNFAEPLWKNHPKLFILLGLGIMAAYAFFIFVSASRFNRAFSGVRNEERQLHPELFRGDAGIMTMFCEPQEYRSRTTLLGLPLVHCRWGRVPEQDPQPAVGWIACGDKAYGILYASGRVAVGGISLGAVSVGIISIGGLSFGLFTFAGLAIGGVAMGGAAIGLVASGGIAIAWHAAIGGVAAAHELALGGAVLANHANDPVAREFFIRHYWLDITRTSTRNVFWTVCFAPMFMIFLQIRAWTWWRRKQAKRPNQN